MSRKQKIQAFYLAISCSAMSGGVAAIVASAIHKTNSVFLLAGIISTMFGLIGVLQTMSED